MSLQTKLEADLKTAMLARNEVTVAEYRRFADESGYRTEAELSWGPFRRGAATIDSKYPW